MNKKIMAMALTAAMAVTAIGTMSFADDEQINILINGEALNIDADDTQPFIENERTLVPMRAIFEALGAEVNWDGETRTVVSYDPISEVSIVMQIDSTSMFVNEQKVELEVPAKIVNDRTVVPVRAIAEGMNCVVDWDGDTRTVIITKDLQKSEEQEVQIPNPWQEYATLEELNNAINQNGDVKYQVADSKNPVIEVKENGYRYLPDSNLAEIQSIYNVGSSAEVIIRTMPGDADISGISGAEKVEEYLLGNSTVEIYKYGDILYATWTDEGADTLISHSVSIETADFDATAVLKELVEDVETNYPRG